uniref:RNA-directed RNA polymerase n=1 Tax=Jitepeofons virus TaxID=3072209 RepID=A0AA96NLC4_9VIRU|nr:MAG: RNA-dependent RNA polymerase [Jitepeofons virus]
MSQRHQVDDGSRYNTQLNLWRHIAKFKTSLTPASEEFIISRYNGPKRLLLEQAKESLVVDPLTEEDAAVTMFLKADKSHEEKYTAPRCIQYRNKRYCLRLATYIHPIEEHFYTMTDKSGTPIAAKSRNLHQRGADLKAKWDMFEDPVAIPMDHSKYDAHCGVELLGLEHKFYKSFYRNSSGRAELCKLLKWQLHNRGSTKNGTHYTTVGTRMSGEQNTGLGNTVTNFAMLSAFNKHYNLNACFYVDGDDSVLICERTKAAKISAKFFLQFGMNTVMEELVDNFSHVEFCQTRPVFDGVDWRMVRNPHRLLARTPWIVYNLPRSCHNRYLRSVGLCEMALGQGLPVGQFIGRTLSQVCSKKYMITDLHYVAKREKRDPAKTLFKEPTEEARLSYEEAWGVSPTTQRLWEATGITDPDLGGSYDHEETPFSV